MSTTNIISPTAAADLSNGAIQAFVVNKSGQILSRWKLSSDSNSGWTEWSAFQPLPGGKQCKSMFAIDLSDKRIQIWGIDTTGALYSCWKETTESTSAWTNWSAFSIAGLGSDTPLSMGGASLSDGRPQIFLTTVQGHVFSCWKTTTVSSSNWTAWSAF